MTIQSRQELECTYEILAEMLRLRDKSAEQNAWNPSLRASIVEGIDAQIRKIERDVQEYLAAQPEPQRVPQPV